MTEQVRGPGRPRLYAGVRCGAPKCRRMAYARFHGAGAPLCQNHYVRAHKGLPPKEAPKRSHKAVAETP